MSYTSIHQNSLQNYIKFQGSILFFWSISLQLVFIIAINDLLFIHFWRIVYILSAILRTEMSALITNCVLKVCHSLLHYTEHLLFVCCSKKGNWKGPVLLFFVITSPMTQCLYIMYSNIIVLYVSRKLTH